MTSATHPVGGEPSLRLRWMLFAFLAASGILALVDRQIISVLKPEMAAELGWTDDDYGTLGAWFQGATAVALLGAGPLVDKLGVKWANPIAVISWSVAALFHGWAHTLVQFTLCRIGLGATEAAVTPTAVKTIATIFPPHMRSTGVGLQNAIASFGAISAPFIIPMIAGPFGWRGAFLLAGAAGLVWAVGWLLVTRKVNFGDAAPPPAAAAETPPRGAFFRDRAAWAVAGAKFLSDSTWWLLLFWMPDFLNRQFGLSGGDIAAPLALAYTGAAAGSLISGTLATRFLARGISVNRVRKVAMLVSALMVLPMPLALQATSPFAAAGVLALVLAAHQGFSTNLFALITDVTPKAKIGRMTSFGVFSGNIGGMLILKVAGMVLAAGLGYLPLFLFASVSYLLALGWIHVMLPNIRLVDAGERANLPGDGHAGA
ncbi:MAG: MFS transporter [Phenylobacterium sp.]|uniref:MFS transporter n=1 Tax=Phenylobacterium sp. TaxID=1871053 RepID=UPI001A46646E|nr:MFS transporter [Phenylobacterium sp.]MBL8771495.1 MFS transporter [Phenylobacterium sp.]